MTILKDKEVLHQKLEELSILHSKIVYDIKEGKEICLDIILKIKMHII